MSVTAACCLGEASESMLDAACAQTLSLLISYTLSALTAGR